MGVHIWGETLEPLNAIAHLLLGVLLLGAVTHHAWLLARGNFQDRTRQVRRYAFWASLAYTLCLLWGIWVYPAFRVYVRAAYQDTQAPWATGLFEIKEHWAALGLAVLPFYYLSSRSLKTLDATTLRWHAVSASWLAIIAWYSFVLGAFLMDMKGWH